MIAAICTEGAGCRQGKGVDAIFWKLPGFDVALGKHPAVCLIPAPQMLGYQCGLAFGSEWSRLVREVFETDFDCLILGAGITCTGLDDEACTTRPTSMLTESGEAVWSRLKASS